MKSKTEILDFSEKHPAKSCQEIFTAMPNLPSGVYWLEFLKVGNNGTFQEQVNQTESISRDLCSFQMIFIA